MESTFEDNDVFLTEMSDMDLFTSRTIVLESLLQTERNQGQPDLESTFLSTHFKISLDFDGIDEFGSDSENSDSTNDTHSEETLYTDEDMVKKSAKKSNKLLDEKPTHQRKPLQEIPLDSPHPSKLLDSNTSSTSQTHKNPANSKSKPKTCHTQETRELNKSYEKYYEMMWEEFKLMLSFSEDNLSYLPKSKYLGPKPANKKTLIFDLDETLIYNCTSSHSNTTNTSNTNTSNSNTSRNDSGNEEDQCSEEMKDQENSCYPHNGHDDSATQNFEIIIRPYARNILAQLKQFYEIVIFTAALPEYANPILDHLDPQRDIIKMRLYRDSCCRVDPFNVFVKDLRVFRDRDMKDIILVDNLTLSFAYQIDNGIPIFPYAGNGDDYELLALYDYLIKIKDVQDIRVYNREAFQLKERLYALARQLRGTQFSKASLTHSSRKSHRKDEISTERSMEIDLNEGNIETEGEEKSTRNKVNMFQKNITMCNLECNENL